MVKYPLFTYEFYTHDPHYNGNKIPHYICIVTAQENRNADAGEKGHKSFYFTGKPADIKKYLEKLSETDLEKIYTKPNYHVFNVSRVETFAVNGLAY